MENAPASKLWEDRWRIGTWILPAFIAVCFAHQAVLPLAAKLRDTNEKLESLRENTYEPSWLDSTRRVLALDVETLRGFRASREASLNREASVQVTVDRIRGLAQSAGIEVIKTTPVLAKSDSLKMIKVRIEGFCRYPGLLAFFDVLKTGHPDLYLEEMLVRQGGERAGGRLEGRLSVHVYENPAEEAR